MSNFTSLKKSTWTTRRHAQQCSFHFKTTGTGCGVHGTKPVGYQLYYHFCFQVFVIRSNDTPEAASDSPSFWFLATTLLVLGLEQYLPFCICSCDNVASIHRCSDCFSHSDCRIKCLAGTTALSWPCLQHVLGKVSVVFLFARFLHWISLAHLAAS